MTQILQPAVAQKLRACRVCGNSHLKPLLSLGEQYSSDFVDGSSKEPIKAPLNLVQCANCELVQLEHTVNRDLIYKKYWYRSSTQEMMVSALKDVVHSVCTRLGPVTHRPLWVDIGANDGCLLQNVPSEFIRVGFEPSNLAKEANTPPLIFVFNDYFSKKLVLEDFGKADAISAIAVFYDLEDPNQFCSDIKAVLASEGIFVIQQNYLLTMLQNNTYENLHHEHLEYYSLATLQSLLRKHGLEVFDAELNPVNGGSIRTYVCHKGAYPTRSSVREIEERERRLLNPQLIRDFKRNVEEQSKRLLDFLWLEHNKGKRIMGYGASSRGNIILQYLNKQTPMKVLIEAIADRNSEKWGLRTLGSDIPIISETEMRQAKPNWLLVLPYHFIENFREREAALLAQGTKFLVPLPEMKIVS